MRRTPPPRYRLYTRPRAYAQLACGGLAQLRGGRPDSAALGELERRLCRRLDVRHALAMPMARVGINLSLRALIRPGAKVILSPYTIADVVNMVVCAGGVPVFADIERGSFNIDPAQVERLLDDDVGAVLVTHFYGLACRVREIVALCEPRGIPVIEDAAQAFGARVPGPEGARFAGTVGDLGILSFGLYKNVTSFLGGAVLVDDSGLAARITRARDALAPHPWPALGRKALAGAVTDLATSPLAFPFTYRVFRAAFQRGLEPLNRLAQIDVDPQLLQHLPPSYLHRMSPAQARMILQQLPGVDAATDQRIAAAEIYHRGLASIPELIVPPLRRDRSHLYTYFTVQFEQRSRLVAHCLAHGRDVAESYHRNCADLRCFEPWRRHCPQARAAASAAIYLPTWPGYGLDQVRENVRVIRAFFGATS
jgi:perosamine synthetase